MNRWISKKQINLELGENKKEIWQNNNLRQMLEYGIND